MKIFSNGALAFGWFICFALNFIGMLMGNEPTWIGVLVPMGVLFINYLIDALIEKM